MCGRRLIDKSFFTLMQHLVGCGHVSGLLMRRGWPLALMLCADHVRTARACPELLYVDAALLGCGHVSGLLLRRGCPLALMLCASFCQLVRTHSLRRRLPPAG